MVTKRVFWASVGLLLFWVAAAPAATLSTPLGHGGVGPIDCQLVNVSATTIPSVTISEYETTFCEGAGNPCHTKLKNSVACTNLAPTDFCALDDLMTATSQPVWCRFMVSGSSKNVRASMAVSSRDTGELLDVLPATDTMSGNVAPIPAPTCATPTPGVPPPPGNCASMPAGQCSAGTCPAPQTCQLIPNGGGCMCQ